MFIMAITCYNSNAQDADARANTPVPFTLADRDRIMKLENSVEMIDQQRWSMLHRCYKLHRSILCYTFTSFVILLQQNRITNQIVAKYSTLNTQQTMFNYYLRTKVLVLHIFIFSIDI